MSLPKINAPEYRLTIPSTDEEIIYRPFLVKEEKLLLIAQETGTDTATYDAIKQIITGCCSGNLNLEKMPLFDMEYIFLNIRAKSVGEITKLKVTCPDDEKTEVEVEVDLTKINVELDDEHDPRIQLTDDIGLLMAYPTMETVELYAVTGTENPTQQLFKLISECIFQIWEGDEVHDASDYSDKEKVDFLDSLSHDQFEKVQIFFETMPCLKDDVEVTNPNTKVKSTVTLRGIQSFIE